MVDVGLGAEAPAADAHTVLVAEHRGDQPVIPAVDREGDHAEIRTRRTEEGHPGHGASRRRASTASRCSRAAIDVADRSHRAGAPQRPRRWPPAGLGCPPRPGPAGRPTRRRRASPHSPCRRRTRRDRRPCSPAPATSAPDPYGAYSLCADRATASRCPASSCGRMSMGRCAASWAASTRIRPPTAWTFAAIRCTVRHDAGDVRRAGHGEQCDATGVACQLGVEVVLVHGSVDQGSDVDHLAAPPPRQQVRVVLEDGRQHDRVRRPPPSSGRSD